MPKQAIDSNAYNRRTEPDSDLQTAAASPAPIRAGTSTISRLLRNEAYIGRLYFNRTETVPAPGATKGHRQVVRPAEEWVVIPVPPIIDDATFNGSSQTRV